MTSCWDFCNFGFLTAGLGQRLASRRLGNSNVVQIVDELILFHPEVRNAAYTMVCFDNSSCCAVLALHPFQFHFVQSQHFQLWNCSEDFWQILPRKTGSFFWHFGSKPSCHFLATMEAQSMRFCKLLFATDTKRFFWVMSQGQDAREVAVQPAAQPLHRRSSVAEGALSVAGCPRCQSYVPGFFWRCLTPTTIESFASAKVVDPRWALVEPDRGISVGIKLLPRGAGIVSVSVRCFALVLDTVLLNNLLYIFSVAHACLWVCEFVYKWFHLSIGAWVCTCVFYLSNPISL